MKKNDGSIITMLFWILLFVCVIFFISMGLLKYILNLDDSQPAIVKNPTAVFLDEETEESSEQQIINNVKMVIIPDGIEITPEGLEAKDHVFELQKDDKKYFITLSKNSNKTVNLVVYKYEVKDYEDLEDILYTDLLLPVKNFQGLYKNDNISITIPQYDMLVISGEAGELGDISGEYNLVKSKDNDE